MSVEIRLTKGKVAVVSDVDADLAALRWYTTTGPMTFYAGRGIVVAGRRSAAVHVSDWWRRRQMRPGFADSTSHNTREEFETLIADLEAG